MKRAEADAHGAVAPGDNPRQWRDDPAAALHAGK